MCLYVCLSQSVFRSSPVLACFLFGLPLGVISLMCYGICTAESDDDTDLIKREGQTDEDEDEEEIDVRHMAAQLKGPGEDNEVEKEQVEKSEADKKLD